MIAAVVRTLNSEDTLDRCLDSLRRQTLPVHIVAVDSGSTDRTLSIARDRCEAVVQLESGSYTPGRALNTGLAACSDFPVVLILSSHCSLSTPTHAERALDLHRIDGVVATNGATRAFDGRAISTTVLDDKWPHRTNIAWGFSNHASTIDVKVWREHQFDEDLDACEDKKWARSVHKAGYKIAYDPGLLVDTAHRGAHGLRNLYRRAFREGVRCGQLVSRDEYAAAQTAVSMVRAYRGTGLRAWAYALTPSHVVESVATARGSVAAHSRPLAEQWSNDA